MNYFSKEKYIVTIINIRKYNSNVVLIINQIKTNNSNNNESDKEYHF